MARASLIAAGKRLRGSLRTVRHSLWRPLLLVAAGAASLSAVVALDHVFSGGRLTRQFFWPSVEKGPEWKDVFQAMVLALGLPIALMLWHWRDLSVRQQIENARKDTTLKEFSELQLRAAGAIDEKLPLGARVALQIAALHQMRSYLRGEYGNSFRLGAHELFLSLLTSEREGGLSGGASHKVPDRVYDAIRNIVAIEWECFFADGVKIEKRSLRDIRVPEEIHLTRIAFKDCDLSGSSFHGVYFKSVWFENCEMEEADLSGSTMSEVVFMKAGLAGAKLSGSTLLSTQILDSNCTSADFSGSSLIAFGLAGTVVDGAILRGSMIKQSAIDGVIGRTDLSRVRFDNRTAWDAAVSTDAVFPYHDRVDAWKDSSDTERMAVWTRLRREGAALDLSF